ncbi:MAG: histidinol dehydrogenase, partial [Salinibacterium sp.]
MALDIQRLNTRDPGFRVAFERLLDRAQAVDPTVETTVRAIVDDVRGRGDAALLDYTERFDQYCVAAAEDRK